MHHSDKVADTGFTATSCLTYANRAPSGNDATSSILRSRAWLAPRGNWRSFGTSLTGYRFFFGLRVFHWPGSCFSAGFIARQLAGTNARAILVAAAGGEFERHYFRKLAGEEIADGCKLETGFMRMVRAYPLFVFVTFYLRLLCNFRIQIRLHGTQFAKGFSRGSLLPICGPSCFWMGLALSGPGRGG